MACWRAEAGQEIIKKLWEYEFYCISAAILQCGLGLLKTVLGFCKVRAIFMIMLR